MDYKYCSATFLISSTLGILIMAVIQQEQSSPATLLAYSHLFDWAFVYYIGMAFTSFLYIYQSIVQRQKKDEYIRLLQKKELEDKKILKAPTTSWILLGFMEAVSSLFILLGIMYLQAFIFLIVSSVSIVFLHFFANNQNKKSLSPSRQLISSVGVFVGQLLVGIAGAEFKEFYNQVTVQTIVLGIIFTIIAMIVLNYQLIEKNNFMKEFYTEPAQYTFMIGIIVLPIWCLYLVIFYFIPCPAGLADYQSGTQSCYLQDTPEFFSDVFAFEPTIAIVTFFVILVLAIPNSLCIHQFSETLNPQQQHSIANSVAALLAVVSLIFFKEFENKPGFIVMLVIGALLVFIGTANFFHIIKIGMDDQIVLTAAKPKYVQDDSEVS